MPINIDPEVTVIIPTYRRPQRLQNAVRSVLQQTYTNMKVCIYDNASGDGTAAVAAALRREDSRVHYNCHSENIGPYENFKRGMQKVSTPFFSFLSDDDIILPKFLEIGLLGFNRYPNAMFSAASTIVMTPGNKVVAVPLLLWPHDGIYDPPEGAFKILSNPLLWTSILFRREVVDEIGLVDSEIGGPMDFDYQLRVALRFPIVVSKEPGAVFVSHAASESEGANLDYFWPTWKRIVERINGDELISKSNRTKIEAALQAYLGKILINIAVKSMIQMDISEVKRIARVVRRDLRRYQLGTVLWLGGWLCIIPGVPKMLAFIKSTLRAIKVSGQRKDWNGYDFREYLDRLGY